ncbi:unknown [Methanothermobacter thermautotrophicus str. Delta H]|uniref:Uncharacterized protein n=1 Tax=Methanothermobacter thermautotrophicus (strain ATCC 29096 / DSM 1053 / JCM 10044 / NBRC 100330 / Delta H) TaxID=187420 RepID=O27674_METTH|nr:unknown [Methanothermobacter thermautotrophicus str. Delta H]
MRSLNSERPSITPFSALEWDFRNSDLIRMIDTDIFSITVPDHIHHMPSVYDYYVVISI